MYHLYIVYVASPISSSTRISTCLSAYLAVVFHPTWAEGEIEEGGWGSTPLLLWGLVCRHMKQLLCSKNQL